LKVAGKIASDAMRFGLLLAKSSGLDTVVARGTQENDEGASYVDTHCFRLVCLLVIVLVMYCFVCLMVLSFVRTVAQVCLPLAAASFSLLHVPYSSRYWFSTILRAAILIARLAGSLSCLNVRQRASERLASDRIFQAKEDLSALSNVNYNNSTVIHYSSVAIVDHTYPPWDLAVRPIVFEAL